MRKYCLLTCLLLLLEMATAFAMPPFAGGEVTSPFGPRDAGGGASRNHKGIDVGVASGTPIVAPFSGFVEHGAGSGYIYWVEITTPEGGSLLFGDCSSDTLSCKTGYVSAGTVIGYTGGDAYDGPLGYSTGAHAHIEHRLNGTNGSQIDPIPYLTSLGMEFTGNTGSGRRGHDNVPMPWGIEAMQTLGDSMHSILETFVEKIGTAFTVLQTAALALLFVLCVIDLSLPLLTAGLEFSIAQLTGKFFKYGFLYAILLNFPTLINNLFLSFVSSVSGTFIGDASVITENITQPQLLMQKAIFFMNPALNKIASYGAWDFMWNIGNIAIIFLSTWITIGVFFVLSAYITMVYIEFYLAALVSAFTLPFSTVRFTKFVAEGTLGSLVSNTLKLSILSIMVGLAVLVMQNGKVNGDLFGATTAPTIQTGNGVGITGPSEYVALATDAAKRYGVPVNLFLAQIQLESNWNPNAVSEAGAQGIAQFMPDTAAGWGIDPFNPAEALDASAHYMANLYEMFGDWNYALAGYNGGPYSISRDEPLPAWAMEYINAVNGNVTGTYIQKTGIKSEQSVKHVLLCLGLIALAVLTFILPKNMMKYIGGKYEIPS